MYKRIDFDSPPMLKKLWDDSVGSKVISGVLTAAVIALGKYLFNLPGRHLIWIGAVVFLILIAVWYWMHSQEKAQLKATLEVSVAPGFSHVALITIRTKNPGRKPVTLSSVEFVTKQHWDMPDPRRMGSNDFVYKYFEPGTPYITISAEKDSIAIKVLSATVNPGQTKTISFRLVTDWHEGYGIGLFPFHLGVELVYGAGKNRLQLPDLITSLHAYTTLSMTGFDQPIFPTFKPSTIQHDANAVLSRVNEGALVPPEILEILKTAARV